MKRKRKYFKIGDLIIYSFFIIFFTGLGLKIMNLSQERASKVEIYVDSELKYVYPLQKEDRRGKNSLDQERNEPKHSGRELWLHYGHYCSYSPIPAFPTSSVEGMTRMTQVPHRSNL